MPQNSRSGLCRKSDRTQQKNRLFYSFCVFLNSEMEFLRGTAIALYKKNIVQNMNISRIQIEVDTKSINPMLKIWVNLEFEYSNKIPISISGKLCQQNGQILSVLSEYELNTDNQLRLTLKTEQEKNSREKSTGSHSVQLSALLTPKAIESIKL